MPFGFHLTGDTLPSGVPQEDGSRSALAVSSFRLRARLGFSIPAFSLRPARHCPRFRIWRSSSERQRDFNPPEQRAAQRTLWPLLTPGSPSRHLSMPVAQGRPPDLPGYDAPTFTLIPVGYTSRRSVQVSGFDDIGRLTPPCRLVSASCPSGQRFAFGFLQIRSHPRHPCRSANSSPCRASRGLPPPSECALPGAPRKKKPRQTAAFSAYRRVR
jgi:hypothetical protein